MKTTREQAVKELVNNESEGNHFLSIDLMVLSDVEISILHSNFCGAIKFPSNSIIMTKINKKVLEARKIGHYKYLDVN